MTACPGCGAPDDQGCRKGCPETMTSKAFADFISTPTTIWYGPYPCPACLKLIVKASRIDGGLELDCPTLVYPNTVWVEHVCQVDAPSVVKAIDLDDPYGNGWRPGYH